MSHLQVSYHKTVRIVQSGKLYADSNFECKPSINLEHNTIP